MKLQSFVRAFVPALVVALIGFIGAPRGLAAQSPLAASEAAAFMGNWTITLESPQGAFEQTLVLKDDSGKVAGEISNQLAPGALPITDISKAGADLVLKFTGDFQGRPSPPRSPSRLTVPTKPRSPSTSWTASS
jgi:hypothetical protein